MRIAIGCDHGGVMMKADLAERLRREGHTVLDCGTDTTDMVDYPVYAKKTVKTLFDEKCDFAILVCGTGIGMSIAANKIEGVRAALVTDCFSAEMAKAHNDANVITLGARTLGVELAWKIVKSYMGAQFLHGIHEPRVAMLNDMAAV